MDEATQDGLYGALEAAKGLPLERARFLIANAMMETYGDNALGLSASLLDFFTREGPPEFAEVWCGVAAAIYDLQNRAGGPAGTTRH